MTTVISIFIKTKSWNVSFTLFVQLTHWSPLKWSVSTTQHFPKLALIVCSSIRIIYQLLKTLLEGLNILIFYLVASPFLSFMEAMYCIHCLTYRCSYFYYEYNLYLLSFCKYLCNFVFISSVCFLTSAILSC